MPTLGIKVENMFLVKRRNGWRMEYLKDYFCLTIFYVKVLLPPPEVELSHCMDKCMHGVHCNNLKILND